MNEDQRTGHPVEDGPLRGQRLATKVALKLRARASRQSAWFGLGMMGLIGWSVAVPTFLGAGLGMWLDRRHSGRHPWTLSLMMAGLAVGCFNAWRWVAKEDRVMHEIAESQDE